MQKARTLALLLVFIACISPAHSQGMMEGTFVRSLGAGMGAGTAASMGHGKVVRRTAESMIQAQQAMIAQTKAIEQYVGAGIQQQAKKQWQTAEQYFQEALKMIAKRDGPGSPKSAPVLARLANVAKNQHKLDEAIGYQKTVVAFANQSKAQNPTAAVEAQVDLSSLFIDKGDLANAEGVLKQSVDTVRHDRNIPPKTYSTTLRVYGEVLKKLNKNTEAEVVAAELAKQSGEVPATAAATEPPAVSSAAPPAVSISPAPTDVTAPVDAAAAAPATNSVSEQTAPPAGASTVSAATSTEPSATTPASAAPSEPSTSAAAAAAPSEPTANNPPGALLPPPTAEWPVMNSDGKIVSESSSEPSQPAAPPPAAAEPAPEQPPASENAQAK
ncbi:MAG TPA: tetratricopeptide repeat protein [Candidatus Melainabacteria bacterium]|nr:tetratricopeptide repeat protein [Candidatus Melainabacteria bacterium]